MAYYKSKGLLIVRVPFRWERLQRTLNGPLDSAEISEIDRVISDARSRGMQVLLDCHNYGRYKVGGADEQILGTSQVPTSAFADFWRKVADHYKNEGAIYGYGLMNEPHDMGDGTRWPSAAQSAVDAIRKVDSTHKIFVSGDGWSGAHSWRVNNENLDIHDPAGKIVYEAHQYFDNDNSGTYDQGYDEEGAYANVGVDRVQPFVKWLQEKGHRGFVGEFGVPSDDPRWNTVLDNFLSYLKANRVGGTYWAGGPWWGDYPLSIEPTNNFTTDKPQMRILQRYSANKG
jgi:endoglucanase